MDDNKEFEMKNEENINRELSEIEREAKEHKMKSEVPDDKREKNKISDEKLTTEEENKIKKESEEKRGLSAIRPTQDAREKFSKVLKVLAKEEGVNKISQTKAFEMMLDTYINVFDNEIDKENRTATINFKDNLLNIRYHLGVLLKTIRDMEIVAQDAINVAAENANAQINIKDTEIDTLKVKLETAKNRIKELEEFKESINKVIFEKDEKIESLVEELNECRNNISSLEAKNDELSKDNTNLQEWNKAHLNSIEELREEIMVANTVAEKNKEEAIKLMELNKEKDKELARLNKEIDSTAKEITLIERQVNVITQERDKNNTDLISARNTVAVLESALNSLETARKVECKNMQEQYTRMLELEKNALVLEHNAIMKSLELEKVEMEVTLKTLSSKLVEKDEEIAKLKKKTNKTKKENSEETK